MTESRRDRVRRILDQPDFMDQVCAHIANGGNLVDLAETLDISFAEINAFIMPNDARRKAFLESTNVRLEYFHNMVLRELQAIAHLDIRQVFDADGTLMNPKDWPANVARAVQGLDLAELMKGGSLIGQLKKIKPSDKLKALELVGKYTGMFTEKVEHKHTVTLEDLVAGSFKIEDKK